MNKTITYNRAVATKITLILVCILPLVGFAQSANSESESELTVMGAELAGNEEQTIPAWTGGITTPPAAYKVGDVHPDPFG
ncbi:MAG: hypothetical protein COC20_06345, partial [Cellvibrionales bacterium]